MKLYTAHVATAALLILPCGLAIGAALPSGNAPLQDPAVPAATRPLYVTVEAIEGATLRLRPDVGKSQEDAPKGEVEDAFVRTTTGDIDFVVVSCDGRDVLIPFRELRWDGEKECFTADHTKAVLKLLPEFDMDNALENGLERAVDVAKQGWRKISGDEEAVQEKDVREAAAQRERVGETEYYARAEPYFCISALDELELYGTKEEFGGVGKSIVDCNSGRLEFYVVSHGGLGGVGGDRFLIPFSSAMICDRSADEDAEAILYSPHTSEQLASAAKYEAPEEGVLTVAQAESARKALRDISK